MPYSLARWSFFSFFSLSFTRWRSSSIFSGDSDFLRPLTDKDSDAVKIKELDAIEPRVVGNRFVVGVAREAKYLKISTESYFSKWKDAIRNSKLSDALKSSILSNMDYHSFYGLGVIVITIQPQKELSFVGEDIYWRVGDETKRASTPKEIATLARRF